MIVLPAALATPASRLLAALPAPPPGAPVTLAVSDGAFVFDLREAIARAPRAIERVLVLSRLGAHPDAKAPSLQRLWRLEEHVRASGLPVLTLRTAPLVSPDSPLVRKLASRPALPRGGRAMLNPVAESDAVETLARALDGRVRWDGWYEVAGPDVWTLAELAEAAVVAGAPRDGGEWEPALDEIAEHRLAESEPWASTFGITPRPVRDALARKAA